MHGVSSGTCAWACLWHRWARAQETGRDRGTAAAANAAAADAAAAALVAAAAATKVAADAGDMTHRQFRAATKAAAAIAAALVTCQAATRQIGQTAASNTAAHRRGGYRPPRGPGARPGPRHRRAATGTARSAETTQARAGGRPPRTSGARRKRGTRPGGWNGMAPRPTESDRQGATQRPIQAGAHSSNSLEADPAPFGSNHATPHADARMQVRDE